MKSTNLFLNIILAVVILFTGCQASNTTKGSAIGAGAGAVLGGVIGKKAGSTGAGAIIGGAVGAVAGVAIGKYMDKQKKELEEDLDEDVQIERIESPKDAEGNSTAPEKEGLKLTFESGILFDTNSSTLKPKAKENIQKMVKTLQKYEDTNLTIEGHTDSRGSDAHNQKLSESRAKSVADYAKSLGLAENRITTTGFGEQNPVANNSTEEGRSQNRRVEIKIFPNEKLQKDAAEGKIKE